MDQIKDFVASNKDRFLNELIDFLKIPSISADSAYKGDVDRAADWLIDQFKHLNLPTVEKHPTPGHPIVYAEKIISSDLPTVLVYGHYDV